MPSMLHLFTVRMPVLHLFTAPRMRVVLLFIMVLTSTSNQHPIRSADTMYELVLKTDTTTEMTGSVTMYCRTGETAEKMPLSDVQFWLNQTVLREQANITEVDEKDIKFNLTRSHEGYYTCGRHLNDSPKKLLTCKY